MPLSNKQKLKILKIAKGEGYQGDYMELFNQAEEEDLFNTQQELKSEGETYQPEPEPDQPEAFQSSTSDYAKDYKLDVDSLLIDNTRHTFSDKSISTNIAHERTPVNSSLSSFLSDPDYKLENTNVQEKNPTQTHQAKEGGFEDSLNPDRTSSVNDPDQLNKAASFGVKGLKALSWVSKKAGSKILGPVSLFFGANNAFAPPVIDEEGVNTFTGEQEYTPFGQTPSWGGGTGNVNIADVNKDLSAAMAPKIKETKATGGVAGGDENTTSSQTFDDSKLDITSPKGDPWEYAQSGDSIITRKRAIGDKSAGDWIVTKEGTRAHTAIVDTVIKPKAIHKTSVDKHVNIKNPTTIDQLTSTQETKISKILIEDPMNTENKIDSELLKQINIKGSNTLTIQQMLVDNNYDLGKSGSKGNGVDGDWGTLTDAAFKQWSDDNLSLPEYNGVKSSICVEGKECSEKVTNILTQLFPKVDRNDFAPDDAWYRKSHVIALGGKMIWSTTTEESRGSWNDLPDLPPIEIWKDLRVGDLMHLNRRGQDKAKKESKMGYGLDYNTGTEHAGFIIGKDKDGMPLIMHRTNKEDMSVQRMDEIFLDNGTRYKVDGITRPKGMLDNPVINKDHYIFNQGRTDLMTSNLEHSTDPRQTDNYFSTMYQGVINTNIEKLASTTGRSREDVLEAARLGYGIFKTETGDWKGIWAGKGKEFIKGWSNIAVDGEKTLAGYRTIYNQAKNLWKTGEIKKEIDKDGKISMWDYILPAITGNPTDLYRDVSTVNPDYSEASKGPTRIKFNMQTEDAEGKQTILGSWYDNMDISESSLSWYNPNATPNSFNAVTLQVLDYTRKIKQHKEYDPETNTIAGVPLQYAIATMHKSPNLYARVDDDHSVLDYLKLGDRDYSNAVINHSKDMRIDYHNDEKGSGDWESAVEFANRKR